MQKKTSEEWLSQWNDLAGIDEIFEDSLERFARIVSINARTELAQDIMQRLLHFRYMSAHSHSSYSAIRRAMRVVEDCLGHKLSQEFYEQAIREISRKI